VFGPDTSKNSSRKIGSKRIIIDPRKALSTWVHFSLKGLPGGIRVAMLKWKTVKEIKPK
jgi:hypothetical protein